VYNINNVRWIYWLSQHRLINLALIFIYYLLVVLPHEQVGLIVSKIFGELELSIYNLIITIVSTTLLCVIILFFYKKIKKNPNQKIIWFYLISTVLFAILCFKILFVVNIEFVHFVQYAVFAMLCFPLTLNYTHTLIWATLAGALDEAYQYFYLSPHRTEYYDFNDVIINLIGAAFGLIIIKIINPVYQSFSWKTYFQSHLFYCMVNLSLLIAIAFASNILGLYPTDTKAQYLLVKKMPTQFWSTVYPEIVYHILLPLEGLLLMIGLFIFYSKLENVEIQKSTHPFVKTN